MMSKADPFDMGLKDLGKQLGEQSVAPSCATCLAWKPKPNQAAPIFGGCARSGKTTLHYGDVAYVHYTTDLQCCSAWESK